MQPPTPFTSAAPSFPGRIEGGPLQLVHVSRGCSGSWRFEVDEEAVRVLEAMCHKRRVAVCTVCGLARSGKSYLLNLLLGSVLGQERFRVGSTMRACTEGVWMWGATVDDDNTILFLDCEGFGSTESDRTRDSKLMSLCFLLSSVFLLNTKGVLNEGLFNSLALVSAIAANVLGDAHEGFDRGLQQYASKPVLLWVLRDFFLELRDMSGNTFSPDEYLEQALRAQPLVGVDAERARAACEVREALLNAFPERRCATLVVPVVDEAKVQKLNDIPYRELRPEFRKQFEEVQAAVFGLARTHPKSVDGQLVNGTALAFALKRFVNDLNANQALNPRSAWEGVQHTACGALADELRGVAAEKLRRIGDGAPIPGGRPLPVCDRELAKAFEGERQALHEEWRTRAVGDDVVCDGYWEDLQNGITSEEKALERQNSRLADRQLQDALQAWEAWLAGDGRSAADDPRAEALIQLIKQGMPSEPASRAACEALEKARVACVRRDNQLKAAEAELKSAPVGGMTRASRKKKLETEASQTRAEKDKIIRNLERRLTQLRDEAQARARRAYNMERAPKVDCNVVTMFRRRRTAMQAGGS